MNHVVRKVNVIILRVEMEFLVRKSSQKIIIIHIYLLQLGC